MLIIQYGILATLAISLLLGLIGNRFIHGKVENFFVAGRKVSFPLVGFALFAQAVDGNATIGQTTLAYNSGFWAGAAYPIGLSLSLFLLGKFFAQKLNAMKLLTLADFFKRNYNRKIEFIASILMLFSFSLLLAGNISAISFILQMTFDWTYQSSVIIITFIILGYCIAGGIISDMVSDIFQILIFLLGFFLVIFFIIQEYGLTTLLISSPLPSWSLNQLFMLKEGAFINWSTIIALGFGNLLAADFASRIFSAKSPSDAKKGCYISSVLTLLIGLPFAMLPVFISKAGVDNTSNFPVLIDFLVNGVPVGTSIYVICGLIAMSMSTIDGGLLSMGNILSKNILQAQEGGDASFIYFTRLAILPVAAFGIIAAILLPQPGVLLTVAFDIMFSSLLVPFVAAFYINNISEKAALSAILTGGVSRLIFAILTPTSYGVQNTYLYIPNPILPHSFDGLGTLISPLLALIIFIYVQFKHRTSILKLTIKEEQFS
jgi:Na+/proline symporter